MAGLIEGRVYAMVAEERGVDQSQLTPTSALSRDLGMEGDDAVDFFEDFGKEFSVDLKALGEDWDHYFGPEGIPLRTMLLVFVPGSMISILFIKLFPQVPDWACFVSGFLVWVVALFAWTRFFGKKEKPQITIQDLIDCARAGKWTKTLPKEMEQKGLATRIVK